MKRYILYPVFLLFSLSALHAQEMGGIGIHMDKSWYQSGDTAWFCIYLSKEIAPDAPFLNVQLSDLGENIIGSFRVYLQDYVASSYLALSASLPSGMYSLAFTLPPELKPKPIHLATHLFTVINPARLPSYLDLAEINPSNELESTLNIDLTFSENQHSKREQIDCEIQLRDRLGKRQEAELSISVVELDENSSLPKIQLFQTRPFEQSFERHFLLSGQVFSEGEPHRLKDMLALDIQTARVHRFKTTDKGHFNLEIPPFEGEKDFQLYDLFDKEVNGELHEVRLAQSYPFSPKEVKTTGYKQALELNKQRREIGQYFQAAKPTPPTETEVPWPISPDFTIRPGNFEAFPDLETFLESIYTPLKIKRKRNLPIPKLVNPEERPFFKHPPIFLVNHKISSFQEIMKIHMPELIQLDFYIEAQTLKKFWPLGVNGIVSIHTPIMPKGVKPRNLFKVQGFQQKLSYPREIQNNHSPHSPLLSSFIYWHPRLKTDPKGKLNLSFFHPDENGRFLISILARTREGHWAKAEFRYEVGLQEKE